jgi:arylsulfatase A
MLRTRVIAAALAVAAVAAVLVSTSLRSSRSKPSFVLILMDDLGWKDLGVTGSLYYRTPRIDSLASQGMGFSQAYSAAPVCSPSRGGLLSGKAPARTGLTDIAGIVDPHGVLHGRSESGNVQTLEAFHRQVLPLEETTIAEALAEAGYATAHFGKWHVGRHRNFRAEVQGFQHTDPFAGAAERRSSTDDVKRIGALTAASLRFIEANRERPFFLMLSHFAMHRPMVAEPDRIRKYEALPPADQDNPVFAALLESVDESVGAIDAALERLGLAENTVVIFASDNGGPTPGQTSNYPLLGGKSFPYEAGMRTPLFIRWPERIEAGRWSDTRVIHMDLYPTLLEMAGLPLRPGQHVDGLSLMPLLAGTGSLPDRALFFHFPHYTHATGPFASIISHDWKLIRWYNDAAGSHSLFNLADDPGEQNDLAERLPARVEQLDRQLARWQTEANAMMPRSNPDFDRLQPPLKDKDFSRRLAMKERAVFERRLAR